MLIIFEIILERSGNPNVTHADNGGDLWKEHKHEDDEHEKCFQISDNLCQHNDDFGQLGKYPQEPKHEERVHNDQEAHESSAIWVELSQVFLQEEVYYAQDAEYQVRDIDQLQLVVVIEEV